MSLFVDTSAFYAYMIGSEEAHPAVSREFTAALTGRSPLWTTSFVLVETMALLQHRIGPLS